MGEDGNQAVWSPSGLDKVELHVHLEGSIGPDTLFGLARKNGIDLPASDATSLRHYFTFKDFAHFVDVYRLVCSCVRTQEDFETITYDFGAAMARQRIRYAEVTVTPYIHVSGGIAFERFLQGLSLGRQRASRDFGVHIAWIFDIPRHLPESTWPTLEFALAGRSEGVVALGLGGDEAHFPAELFVSVFSKARGSGLNAVPHAGEMAGPESVWTAIRELGAQRIGHGVRSVEDPALVRYLAETRIPLEVCPTSNIRLGVYADYASHPLPELVKSGVRISVNSDDPALFGTNLAREYLLLAESFRFSPEVITQFCTDAVESSFLTDSQKSELVRGILGSSRVPDGDE